MTAKRPQPPPATAQTKRILAPDGSAVVEATLRAATVQARLHGLGAMGAAVACLSAAEIVALDLAQPAQRDALIAIWSDMLENLRRGARNAELLTVQGHA